MREPTPSNGHKHAGVVVPPPLIYAGTLALALAVDHLAGGPGFPLARVWRLGAGGVLFAAGLAIPLIASMLFKLAGTDVRPWKPSSALVTTGVYRYTRNPMYLGMSLAFAGLAVMADSVVALAALVPLLAVITHAVILREERYLESVFGDAYRGYKARVRRWL